MSYTLTLVAARAATTLDQGTIIAARDAARAGPPDMLSPAEAVDLPCASPPDPAALAGILGDRPIDVFCLPAEGRRKRLLTADMDSTIIDREVVDELAAEAGVGEKVAAITARSMAGEIDFATSLRGRVAMLRGLDRAALDRVAARLQLTEGARELIATMRAHGAITALVSGGFTFFTERIRAAIGFSHDFANRLEDDGTTLTGGVVEPVLDRCAKERILRELAAQNAIPLSATMAIGDGANDLGMLRAAGLGIAFHAKPLVATAARLAIRYGSLRAALFAQGYRLEDLSY
uniref:Phosphoserine phosphatase n=1 Tax=Acidicaldus sp. TaxID=1872105 RepID=A0A8J4H8X8_9PROT